ncbi:MAG: murein biosynthesis integral membrane protein MurJ, partial [Aquificae bacterium]|nr:murein biosynthesis integral membrane protein MurJ [Aquificota bacterium]
MIKNLFRPSKEGVIQAIFKTSALNFLARVFGYLKQVSIAVLIGFSFDTDAFFLALSILGIFLTFTQVFDSLGIPNLVKARQKSLTTFHKLTASLLTFTTILAFGITIGVFILSPWLVNIALGFNEIERELLKEYLWLLLPYLFFSFFFHHFGAIHRSLKHFSVYFFGEFL